MDIAKQAILVLADAEQRLRELVGSAAAAGEYDAIQRITNWARTLGALAQQAQQPGTAESEPAVEGAATPSGVAEVIRSTTVSTPPESDFGDGERISSLAVPHPKRLSVKDEYPKFFRRGDQLLKIGWSKKAKEEYEHKAPRWVVDALTAAIARRSRSRKLFMVEDLLPLKDPQAKSEIPSYQAYVVLAWFKVSGLVNQHGRRGYSVRNGSRLADAVAASWQQLSDTSV